MYIQNMLHLDDKVLDGVLYRSCSDYDDDSCLLYTSPSPRD